MLKVLCLFECDSAFVSDQEEMEERIEVLRRVSMRQLKKVLAVDLRQQNKKVGVCQVNIVFQ